MTAVELRGVIKRYGRREALAGLDLTIPAGSAFGLVGGNGAGKTTCVKILLDVVRPTAGDVRVLGGHPSEREVRRRVGYLPERLQLPASRTAQAFLASVARLKGLADPAGESALQLERVGMASEASQKLRGFSKGMRQKIGLAAALLGAPSLLVLDEPTDGIDPLGRLMVRRLLEEERRRGATLFLNSHLLSETERICDRIGILAGGKLVVEGSLADLRKGSSRWRVRIEPHPEPARLGLEATSEPWTFHLEAEDPRALNWELDRLRREGAILLELVQVTRSLEDLLAETVEAA